MTLGWNFRSYCRKPQGNRLIEKEDEVNAMQGVKVKGMHQATCIYSSAMGALSDIGANEPWLTTLLLTSRNAAFGDQCADVSLT